MRQILAVMTLIISLNTYAAIAPPMVGEPAPPLTIGKWLKGKPVSEWKRGSVYIIDIWAPWCGPCLGGMQHLTDLQKKNAGRGLVVIGMSGPDDYGSTLAKAQKVVADKGHAIGYNIAWDEGHRMFDLWMAREKGAGWPWSFIIDREGRVAFVGHPEHLDEVLTQVLDGTFNLEAAAKSYRERFEKH
jgi:thiol-disulfide isomerase/thioredoxin